MKAPRRSKRSRRLARGALPTRSRPTCGDAPDEPGGARQRLGAKLSPMKYIEYQQY